MSFNNAHTEINGLEVKTTFFSASKAFKVHYKFLGRIGRSIGATLGPLTDVFVKAAQKAAGGKGAPIDSKAFIDTLAESDVDFSFIGEAIAALYDSMDEDEALKFIKYILEKTSIDGAIVNDTNFEKQFGSGNMVLLYKIVKFVLEANFPDFFGAFRSITKETPKGESDPEATVAP